MDFATYRKLSCVPRRLDEAMDIAFPTLKVNVESGIYFFK